MQKCILQYQCLLACLKWCVSAQRDCMCLCAQCLCRVHIPYGMHLLHAALAVASDWTAWVLQLTLQAVSTVSITHVLSSSFPLHKP